ESDRASIQDEIDQLTTEIDRVAETTKFNETYLLKGDYGTKTINIKAHDAGLDGTLTQNTTKATFTVKALSMGDEVTIGGTNYTIGVSGTNTATMLSNAQTILGATSLSNGEVVKIDGKSFTIASTTNVETSELAATELNKFASNGSTIEYNGKSVTLFNDVRDKGPSTGVDSKNTTVITQKKAYELMQNELRAASSIGADTVIGDPTVKKNGTDTMDETSANVVQAGANDKFTFTMTKGTAEVQNDLTFNLHVGSDADMTNKIGVTIKDMSSASLGIQGLNVADATGKAATYAIDAIADAVATVSAQRGSLGAIQNRLEHTIANVDNVVENTNAAESRIRDTDMADEMVNYSKNNILQQAGQAMLAQANQSTQGVLSILG
ncbi:MAG: flagellar hook protein, partial [Pseudobutyrivibrio sp.]|nr:flagellar hook protein [Pseudobutyrivibrio sp.]